MTNSTIDKDNQAYSFWRPMPVVMRLLSPPFMICTCNRRLNYGCCLTNDIELVKDCVQDVFVRLMDRQHASRVKRVAVLYFHSTGNRLVDEFRKGAFCADTPITEAARKQVTEDVEWGYLESEKRYINRIW